ncbi:P-loop ATPase, Sll1717 family [Chloroflexota bacterium]
MEDKKRYEKYRLGHADAWSELERDMRLKEEYGFLPVRQFHDIIDSDNTFLCGRRGSGKSAIAINLMNENPWTKRWEYREALEGERDRYREYMEIVERLCTVVEQHSYVNLKAAVQRLWEWALRVKAMQAVVIQSKQRGEPVDADLQEIERYLEELPDPLHIQSSMGHLLANTFDSAMENLNNGKFNTFLLNLSEARTFLSAAEALQRKTKRKKVLLVIDTLESYRIWAPFMIEGFRGILEAVNTFRTDPRMWGVSLKFFIPAEIYDKVFTGIPDKVGSGTIFMRWRSSDLISILSGRFLSILERTESIPKREIKVLEKYVTTAYESHDGKHLREPFWYENEFLPRRVKNNLGQEEDCFAYIFRHTFRRPRDVMMYQMQAIINRALDKGEFPKISNTSVVDGVHDPQVMMHILGAALSPFEGPIPGGAVEEAINTFYEKPWIMSGRELKNFANILYSIEPFRDIEVEDFVLLLLRAGVVGLVRSDLPSKLYHKARFEYLMPDNLPLTPDLRYCVHPVMGDLFHMVPPEEGKTIYPLPEQDTWLEDEAKI